MKNILLESFKKASLSNKDFRNCLLNNLSSIDHYCMSHYLDEGLIHTYDLRKTEAYIKKFLSLEDWQVRFVKSEIGITCCNFVINDDTKRIEKAKDFMDHVLGWYVTSSFKWQNPIDKNQYAVLEFRPKFLESDKLQDHIKANPILWHCTTLSRYQKIKKQGFVPKSSNSRFKYPDRVHFLLGDMSMNDTISCLNLLKASSNKEQETWVILKVDVRKKDDSIPKFHYDPDFSGAVFSYENIFPRNISIEKEIEPEKKRNLTETIQFIEDEFKKLDNVSSFDNRII